MPSILQQLSINEEDNMRQGSLLVIILFSMYLMQGCFHRTNMYCNENDCWKEYGESCVSWDTTTRSDYSYGRGFTNYGYTTTRCTGGSSDKFQACMKDKGCYCGATCEHDEYCRIDDFITHRRNTVFLWKKCASLDNPGCAVIWKEEKPKPTPPAVNAGIIQ
jgi:hypothetical protein